MDVSHIDANGKFTPDFMTAEVLRLGSRVATTRMEFLGADNKLLTTGSAAYMVA